MNDILCLILLGKNVEDLPLLNNKKKCKIKKKYIIRLDMKKMR